MLDEVLHVIALVGTQGLRVDLPAPGAGEQLAGRLMPGSPVPLTLWDADWELKQVLA